MKRLRSLRVLLLALLACIVPISSHAAVLISVGFAPPVLPVYEQPPCPQPGWMWTPGYWAYGPDGYYWVPGTWVPAPYEGALWTPGYWGFENSLYIWHPGYWGRHVGYYGGVNYGFGFFGVGFVGGAWRGHVFAYNTAVVRVNTTIIRNTYVDRTVIVHNDNRVAFNGGPGGINRRPTPDEERYSHEQHMAARSYQVQHRNAAMQDHSSYFNNNHGHPNNTAMERPAGPQPHESFNNNNERGRNGSPGFEPNHGNQGGQPHPAPQPQMHEQHNTPQPQVHEQHNNPQPQMHEQQHNNPRPEIHENRPAPQQHEQRGNEGHDHGRGH